MSDFTDPRIYFKNQFPRKLSARLGSIAELSDRSSCAVAGREGGRPTELSRPRGGLALAHCPDSFHLSPTSSTSPCVAPSSFVVPAGARVDGAGRNGPASILTFYYPAASAKERKTIPIIAYGYLPRGSRNKTVV